MSRPIQGELTLKYTCPKCKTNVITQHTHSGEFEMIPKTEHWASRKKLQWEGQCPQCYYYVEVVI